MTNPFDQPPSFEPSNESNLEPAGVPAEATVLPEPPSSTRPRRNRIVAAVAAVAVLAVGGIVVANNLASSDGGFDSPEAAVRGMFHSLSQQDILGVIDVLSPGERSLVRDTLLPVEQQMERLQVLQDKVNLHKVPGFSVVVNGLTTSTENVGDKVAVVTLTGGTVTSTASLPQLPIGTLFHDKVDPAAKPTTTTNDLKGDTIGTVKVAGRWYVSFEYSIAEAARRSAHKDMPDFAHPVPAPGAASPEAAITDFLNSTAKLDLAGIIGSLAPSEFAALQDYGTLFLADAQRKIDDAKQQNGIAITIEPGTPKVDVNGDTATLTYTSVSLKAETGGRRISAVLTGDGCATIVIDESAVTGTAPTTTTSCAGQVPTNVHIPAALKPVLQRMTKLSVHAVAVRENGAWYFAPIRSGFNMLDQLLSAFDTSDELKAFVDWVGTGVNNAVLNGLGGSTDASGTDVTGDTIPMPSFPPDTAPFDTSGTSGSETVTTDTVGVTTVDVVPSASVPPVPTTEVSTPTT